MVFDLFNPFRVDDKLVFAPGFYPGLFKFNPFGIMRKEETIIFRGMDQDYRKW